MVVLHTVVAIVLVVALIIRFKVDPVISLVVASLYLGLASDVGFAGTVTAITGGFGEIMVEVGLLIGFGVLIGSLLHRTGAFEKLVHLLVSRVGGRRLPYAMTTLLSTLMPSIYVDVQVVLASPVARSSAPHVGRRGLPRMASAVGAGIFCGYVFVIPGLAAISIAGLLEIRLGTWLLYGLVIGPVTAVLTTMILGLVLRTGFWKDETDTEVDEALAEMEAADAAAPGVRGAGARDAAVLGSGPDENAPTAASVVGTGGPTRRHDLGLGVLLLPILVPLALIAFGAFAELFEFTTPLIDFLGDANVALFIGLLGAYALARWTLGGEETGDAMTDGFHTSGEILLITGVGGSLGAVIKATGLDKTLGDLFSADAGAPIVVTVLLAWVIAAILHLAIGSVSVAAITAAGIIAPVVSQVGVAPIGVGLAIASGALFALQVNSNFFWMFKSLLGLSTSGALKTLTLATTVASVVSLPMVMVVAFAVPA
ncbi:MAG: GntP family permease [Nocardioides sp.]|uniref:GntP family permease n=1 Tax=Nocardioides sp. TaxID=35761 RepID=UPI003F0C3D9D